MSFRSFLPPSSSNNLFMAEPKGSVTPTPPTSLFKGIGGGPGGSVMPTSTSSGLAALQEQTQSKFLRVCFAMNVVTLFAGLLSVLANITIVFSELSPQQQLAGCEVVVRCYGIAFGLMVILAELEWPTFFQLLGFLESWVLRGLFLIFVGSLLECFPNPGQPPTLRGLRLTAAYLLISMGLLYSLLGIFCSRLVKLRQASRTKNRKLMAQEVVHLQAQKHEIEMLLADTESKLQHL